MTYRIATYDNKTYAIIYAKYKKKKYPILFNYEYLDMITNIKKWKADMKGFIYSIDDNNKKIYMHRMILQDDKPILHINRKRFDNRVENLIYNLSDVENKNIKKYKRSYEDENELPTYVYYMKPDKTHGERYMVKINNIIYKTSSCKNLSKKFKLEQAKAYIRELQTSNPELFDKKSMNGKYNNTGIELLNSYKEIMNEFGYGIKKIKTTDTYLNYKKLKDENEEKLLESFDKIIYQDEKIKITYKSLPEYCYYKKPYKNQGDCFIIKKNDIIWTSTSSKKISILEKYHQLIDKIDKINEIS